jgi:hypothetical protein
MRGSDAKSGKVRALAASASPPLTGVPSLSEASADPSLLAGLPFDQLLNLKRQHGHLGAELDTAILRRIALDSGRAEPVVVLDVTTAAHRLATSPDSLYRKHKRLRLGYKDPLDGRLKFTEEEINAYVRRHRGG